MLGFTAAVAVTAILVQVTGAISDTKERHYLVEQPRCSTQQRASVLRREQSEVLKRVGSLSVLNDPADLRKLGQAPLNYGDLTHGFTSYTGMGVTVMDSVDKPRPGVPNILFYAPNPDAKNVVDSGGADYPYKLIGWGYGLSYKPGRPPAIFRCLGVNDWHVHERGIDRSDGTTVDKPPSESFHGQASGSYDDPPAINSTAGGAHPRSWVLNFWLDGTREPGGGMIDPIDPPAGQDPKEGKSFFSPQQPPGALPKGVGPLTSENPAKALAPYVYRAGKGEQVTLRASRYVYKATGALTGHKLALMDINFVRGSEPPTHVHGREDEAFYLLEGGMTFTVAGQRLRAGRGDFVFLPRGIPHSYTVDGGTARALLIAVPAGLDEFFKAVSKRPQDVQQIGKRFGFLPPPSPGKQAPKLPGKPLRPFLARRGEGDVVSIKGGRYVFTAPASRTGNGFSLTEQTLRPGGEPAPHVHTREEEAFYVLDGRITFESGETKLRAGPGDFVYLPRYLHNTFTIHSAAAHVAQLLFPGGLETFFKELAKNPQGAQQIGAKYGLGPAPSQPK